MCFFLVGYGYAAVCELGESEMVSCSVIISGSNYCFGHDIHRLTSFFHPGGESLVVVEGLNFDYPTGPVIYMGISEKFY
jgi:hypothetical protein